MTCEDFEDESKVIAGDYPSPEMIERCREHRATCVDCGGVRPSRVDLEAIFRDMFLRVGHQELCQDSTCRCRQAPVSEFEKEVIRQFRRPA